MAPKSYFKMIISFKKTKQNKNCVLFKCLPSASLLSTLSFSRSYIIILTPDSQCTSLFHVLPWGWVIEIFTWPQFLHCLMSSDFFHSGILTTHSIVPWSWHHLEIVDLHIYASATFWAWPLNFLVTVSNTCTLSFLLLPPENFNFFSIYLLFWLPSKINLGSVSHQLRDFCCWYSTFLCFFVLWNPIFSPLSLLFPLP